MAGEWLKIESCTPDKSEVLAITAKMGWDDPDLTVGKLFRIWRWFDQHTLNGNADGVTPALLDRISGVTGFCEAMNSVGWLLINEAGIQLPNFSRHNGNTSKQRALTAKRVARNRAYSSDNEESNADGVTSALAREEKKREEKKREDISPSLRSGESAETAPPADPEKPKARKAQTLTAYLAECKSVRVKPVPDDHHIRRWSADAGVTSEMLQIAWVKFRERYTEGEKGKGKRYKDWPGHFATAVKDNWFKLWFADGEGVKWTSNGLTCKTVLDAQMKQQEAAHAA